MKAGSVVTALVAMIVMGTAAYQWKTMVQSEMRVAQRNRYEHLFTQHPSAGLGGQRNARTVLRRRHRRPNPAGSLDIAAAL